MQMSRRSEKRYLIDKVVEIVKFCFTLALLGFLAIKAPNETSQIVSASLAFIFAGTKIGGGLHSS